jgi:hypothetical protein
MPQKRAKDLSRRELETIVAAIQAALWFDEHGDPDLDKQWTPDTLDDIALVMDSFGLCP